MVKNKDLKSQHTVVVYNLKRKTPLIQRRFNVLTKFDYNINSLDFVASLG